MSETILTFKHFISSNNFSFFVFSSSASVLSWLKTLIASSSIDGLSVLKGLPGSKTELRSQNLQKSQPNSSFLSLEEAEKHNTKHEEFIVTSVPNTPGYLKYLETRITFPITIEIYQRNVTTILELDERCKFHTFSVR